MLEKKFKLRCFFLFSTFFFPFSQFIRKDNKKKGFMKYFIDPISMDLTRENGEAWKHDTLNY